MLSSTSGVWYNNRQSAGPGLGGCKAEGFRITAMDQGIGAGEEGSEAVSIAFNAEQADVRIATDLAFDFCPLASVAEQYQTDRH
jgi:hypothetical protein